MHKEILSSMRVIYGLESLLSCGLTAASSINSGRLTLRTPHIRKNRDSSPGNCRNDVHNDDVCIFESDESRRYCYERDENFYGYRNIGLCMFNINSARRIPDPSDEIFSRFSRLIVYVFGIFSINITNYKSRNRELCEFVISNAKNKFLGCIELDGEKRRKIVQVRHPSWG